MSSVQGLAPCGVSSGEGREYSAPLEWGIKECRCVKVWVTWSWSWFGESGLSTIPPSSTIVRGSYLVCIEGWQCRHSALQCDVVEDPRLCVGIVLVVAAGTVRARLLSMQQCDVEARQTMTPMAWWRRSPASLSMTLRHFRRLPSYVE